MISNNQNSPYEPPKHFVRIACRAIDFVHQEPTMYTLATETL